MFARMAVSWYDLSMAEEKTAEKREDQILTSAGPSTELDIEHQAISHMVDTTVEERKLNEEIKGLGITSEGTDALVEHIQNPTSVLPSTDHSEKLDPGSAKWAIEKMHEGRVKERSEAMKQLGETE